MAFSPSTTPLLVSILRDPTHGPLLTARPDRALCSIRQPGLWILFEYHLGQARATVSIPSTETMREELSLGLNDLR